MSALDDVAIVAVAGAIGLLTWEVAHVKIPAIPSPGDLFKGIGVPNLNPPSGIPGAILTQPTATNLCADIATWRTQVAPGFIFGIGAKDPYDWQAFRMWEATRLPGAVGYDTPDVPPVCWNEAVSPSGNTGGLGY